MMLALGAAAAVLLPAQLELRGGEAAPPGRVLRVDASGAVLTAEASAITNPAPSVVIGWDRVRSVGGEFEAAAAPFGADAEKAWRARVRLERGDAIGAEPLFEELFGTLGRGPDAGPTAALVAEGLLRCRLRRGAHVAAVEPWLALRRASPPASPQWLHPDWAGEAGLPAVLDPKTRLIPGIPPMWVGVAAARSLSALPAGSLGATDDASGSIAALYLAAARYEAGETVATPPVQSADAGVALVADVVASRIGTPEEREAARKALAERAGRADTPPWVLAWCRAALGRSMILEPDAATRDLGVIELLRLPAELGDVHPYLTGLALAQASVTLRSAGDGAGADTLRDELVQRYPSHPVLDWPPIMARTVPRPQRTP